MHAPHHLVSSTRRLSLWCSERELWKGEQIDERGRCTKWAQCDCFFPRDLDKYTLTSSYLEVRRSNAKKYCGVRLGRSWGEVTNTKNRLHMSKIDNVDSFSTKEGCFADGYAEVHVSAGDESQSASSDDNWRTLGRESRSSKQYEVIKVENETHGDKLVQEIENARHEYTVQAHRE
jgi:hypothetical protein